MCWEIMLPDQVQQVVCLGSDDSLFVVFGDEFLEKQECKVSEGVVAVFWDGDKVEDLVKDEEWDLVLIQNEVTPQVGEAVGRGEAGVVSSPEALEGVVEEELDDEAGVEEEELNEAVAPHWDRLAVEFSCLLLHLP